MNLEITKTGVTQSDVFIEQDKTECEIIKNDENYDNKTSVNSYQFYEI